MIDTITFEVGDIVECPYYNFRGEITKFGTGDKKLITLMDKEGVECFTKLRTVSANSTLPFYLRLICKKDDIDKILNDVLGL